MKTFGKALIGGALAMSVGSALAAPIGLTNSARPAGGISIGNSSDAAALCQPTYANCELQSIVNVHSGNTLSAANDQINQAMFAIGPGPAEVMVPFLRIEVTANAGTQIFGIFSDADGLSETNDRSFAPIFNGPATNGAVATVLFDFVANTVLINGTNLFGGIKPSSFGFYLQPAGVTGATLYSADVLNPNNGTQFIAYNVQPANRWILGFEDVFRTADASQCNKSNTSDCDHNDIVVTIESIVPSVPEPGTLALLGFGLMGLGAAGRRRRNS